MEERLKFGRYELVERLAVGGMAELYRAVLTGPSGFRKTVAIKVIKPTYTQQDSFRDMFLHEGRVMAALSHRNLVQVFDLGEINQELFMCLEYVPGCNLSQVIRRLREENTPMDPFLAAWIAREVCQALEYVHGVTNEHGTPLNIVHRDVNPPNVLLSKQGEFD